MAELQNNFVLLADSMIQELDRSRERSSQAVEERKQWEARLVELDTVNRSHIEHLDRKFHELNVWQQRVEGLAEGRSIPAAQQSLLPACVGTRPDAHEQDPSPLSQTAAGLTSRLSDLESRMVQQEGLAAVAAETVAILRAEKADASNLPDEADRIRYAFHRACAHALLLVLRRCPPCDRSLDACSQAVTSEVQATLDKQLKETRQVLASDVHSLTRANTELRRELQVLRSSVRVT